MSLRPLAYLLVAATGLLTFTGCGADTGGRVCAGVSVDTQLDPLNCGACGTACSDGYSCQSGHCAPGECKIGEEQECYTGQADTEGIGLCHSGRRICDETGMWGRCFDEVVPVGENGPRMTDGLDNNCNGAVDEDEDADGDGQTTHGGDCCDSTECDRPELVNDRAFDAPGNNFDDDCNGVADDAPLICDSGIMSNTPNAMDFARAIDICQVATMADNKWGVLSAQLSLTDGTGTPDPNSHSVRPGFGTGLGPRGGVNLALLSTGGAAAENDTNPSFQSFSYTHLGTTNMGCTSAFSTNAQCAPFPADFLSLNNNTIPNAPNCPAPLGTKANDPVMLTLELRVPSNAQSFKLSTNFYSAEFPEYTCSAYNDFFVVLLDSEYAGSSPNPMDKNLAFYSNNSMKYPVGVNLAHGNTGLFTQCTNGSTGCFGTSGDIDTCTGVSQLAGTGFDENDGSCDDDSLEGGATGWLVTTGNVKPGEIIKLRIAIWDTSDHSFDSTVVIDGFQWSVELATPGTTIFKTNPKLPKLDTVENRSSMIKSTRWPR